MADAIVFKVKIVNRLGLHARPAMAFVDTANAHDCLVRVRKGETDVDGKSIMEMMMLAATQGSELEIELKGPGSERCAEALKKLINRGFDEE